MEERVHPWSDVVTSPEVNHGAPLPLPFHSIDEKPAEDKDIENIVALDEGDIALLKTYASSYFCVGASCINLDLFYDLIV